MRNIQKAKKKFLTTMVIILISATVLNYGLFSFLSGYFKTVDTVYNTSELNIFSVLIVMAVVIIIMFVLIPKETTDNIVMGTSEIKRTPAQELQDMIDDELEKE